MFLEKINSLNFFISCTYTNGDLQEVTEIFIDFVLQNLPVTDQRLQQIRETQDKDPPLKRCTPGKKEKREKY